MCERERVCECVCERESVCVCVCVDLMMTDTSSGVISSDGSDVTQESSGASVCLTLLHTYCTPTVHLLYTYCTPHINSHYCRYN